MLSLRPYQEQAADFLYEHDRALVLAPVGSGKTAITLTTMRDMVQNHSTRWLVLAPLRVAEHVWPAEAQKWAPDLALNVAVGSPNKRMAALYGDGDAVVTNYDNIQWLADLDLSDFSGIVFDELTRLKDPSGKRFKALEKVIKHIDIRWGLTGSFTSNGLEDVFGQCKIVDQSLLGRSKGAFLQQYFYCLNRDFNDWTPMPGALEAVMQRIKPATFLLEGASTDRELHVVPMVCEMDLREYEQMKKNFVVEFPDATAVAQSAGVVTQKLQQMAAGFLYTPEPRWLSWHKFEMLDDILVENQGANTIVFYNYIAEFDELVKRYPKAETLDAPNAVERWNAGKIPILLAHPKSAQFGLNLQDGGHHMVFMSLPWSLIDFEQAVGRLHRSGQQHDVWVYVLTTRGTIDEKIMAALKQKKSMAELAVEALK